VYFFDTIQSSLYNIASWFDSVGYDFDSLPAIGSYIGYPFHAMSSPMYNAAAACATGSSWADNTVSNINSAHDLASRAWTATQNVVQQSASALFQSIRGYIEAGWWILTASDVAVFDWIYAYIQASWWILTASAAWVFSWLQSSIEGAYSILTASAWTIYTWLQSYVLADIARLAILPSTVWSWITSGRLQDWIETWWDGQSAAVLSFVTNSWGYLITSAFTFLGNNWSSFESSFAWLCGKVISLLTKEAGSFAGALWALLEAVLDNIERPGA
jgi:hypothetical protein